MLPEKLKNLENNLAELQRLAGEIPSTGVEIDTTKQWALRYGLFESIQIVIDISCHIVAYNNYGSTKTYRECIEALEKFKVVDQNLSTRLKAMIGLRNILVHDYVKVDDKKLFGFLQRLDDFRSFANAVRPYMESDR